MIILRQHSFSDKKRPKRGIREYKDYDGKSMTRSQQREAIEEEGETAEHNAKVYRRRRGWKGAGIGAASGAALGLLNKGEGKVIAIPLALVGSSFGAVIGHASGNKAAKRAGHDRDRRELVLARRFDDDNAERGVETELAYQTKRDQADRHREQLDKKRNAYMAQMAINSWR